jgi:phosphoribosyl-ATP pyrophosphohydrolase
MAQKVGFDWEEEDEIFDKIQEEIEELKSALKKRKRDEVTEEFGDLFFSLLNLARRIGVNPEYALKLANEKFLKRFRRMRKVVGKKAGLREMDKVWEKIKKRRFP